MDTPKTGAYAPLLARLAAQEELAWINPARLQTPPQTSAFTMADVDDAEARLLRFAPLVTALFPETQAAGGLIESPLTPVPAMQRALENACGCAIGGRLLLKEDNRLPIAGSVKARGGIYEVLRHTETLALQNGLLSPGDGYTKLASAECRQFFGGYTLQVASTGNLGLSVGISGAALGYRAVVHMSADARQWKKDLLRSRGVTVVEYAADYSAAVAAGRAEAQRDAHSYFIDDENSRDLFLGYAVAAKRLAVQLAAQNIAVDGAHPLFVHIPCGVGGAPGGITFGLRQLFGENAHCFFIEPAASPCVLLGMATGRHGDVCVGDIGLSGKTHADGLAVGRASGLVTREMMPLASGVFTVGDAGLYDSMRLLLQTEGIFLEPSACAAFEGPVRLAACEEARRYLAAECLAHSMDGATHIAWATGGGLVPPDVRAEYERTFLRG